MKKNKAPYQYYLTDDVKDDKLQEFYMWAEIRKKLDICYQVDVGAFGNGYIDGVAAYHNNDHSLIYLTIDGDLISKLDCKYISSYLDITTVKGSITRRINYLKKEICNPDTI